MSRPIDLRSDTVTKPSEAMRAAMASAEVGDDWYGDDPTVNRLQEKAADVLGKEAGLYVATGTMANQIALHVLCGRGHFVACEQTSHVATTEVSTSAILSGIAFHGMHGEDGRLAPDQVRSALEPDPYDVEVIDVLSLENTHQVGGGTPWPIGELHAATSVAREHGTSVYMDGARLFNASAATGTPARAYADEVDATMFCLSKGLGAPIGSVLCGSSEFIREARRTRILIGGAWRQAGIMAAAGLVALEEGPKRLHEDHERATRLAEGIAEATPAAIDPAGVRTNILFVDTAAAGIDPWEAWTRLKDAGVLSNVVSGRLRLVTHLGISVGDVDEAVVVWRKIAGNGTGTAAEAGGHAG
jgi:threonine aldolase